jgi:Na+/phosphate symporter
MKINNKLKIKKEITEFLKTKNFDEKEIKQHIHIIQICQNWEELIDFIQKPKDDLKDYIRQWLLNEYDHQKFN